MALRAPHPSYPSQANAFSLSTHHYGATTPAGTDLTDVAARMRNGQPLRTVAWSKHTS
jgi:hypothetical protein